MNAKRAILIILDGWGHGPKPAVSAIAQADTPFVDSLYKDYPNSELVSYGLQVGLPEGQMGNSEVGHMNIGAGRIIYQELVRINKAVEDKEFHTNPTLIEALDYAKTNNKAVHIFGLVSDGGVHSHINHLKALTDICEDNGLSDIFIHAFLDGRDTDPKSGLGYVGEVLEHLEGKDTKLASVIGRYYAMDRDNRWERIKIAYDLLVNGEGEKTTDALKTMSERYAADETDEFIKPILCVDEEDKALATIKEGDVVICFNFRTDRPRQITRVLTQEDMPEHDMKKLDLHFVAMTNYDEKFKNLHILFDQDNIENTMGEVLSGLGKTQLRIAETEKYAHVTFFFSGGRESEFPGENRILIPSPKVATYDLQPEMSAPKVKDAVIADIKANEPDFICLNFANADMVGHTGIFSAAKKAAETVDACLRELITVALDHDYEAIIIADHGNSDYMKNDDGSPNTAHSQNPVPCIYVSNNNKGANIKNGKLADIAPTMLTMLGIDIPEDMTGEVLL